MVREVNPADIGITIGQVFLGKYRVDAIIGHGGMGVVAECTHLALNERVAIKMLRQDVLRDQDAVQRFIREAQAAVKLKSEYVARVSDVGTFENGVPYMVMEYLEGHDMGQLIEQRGVLPVPWASELMMQTAEALSEAHAIGIVHRDVKPTNLFVTWRPDGTALVKVLDFGISKSPMGSDMQLTQTQSLLGTPAYMSPEQMRSARLVDSRSDIWSLGTVFYEVLEGRRPFEAESFSEMCVKVAVDAPMPMVNTPPALQQVILKCLAKAPEQRYGNMAEFGHDLIQFTTDQHQAQRLVDRMTRMLRRSHHSWDGDSTSNAPRANIRDAASSGAQWGVGSDPGGTPWQVKSDPAGAAWQAKSEPFGAPYKTPHPGQAQVVIKRTDGSEPFVKPEIYATAPSTIMNTPLRRRWPLWLGAITVLAGVGIALGFVLSGDADAPPTVPAAAAPPTDTISRPATTTPTTTTTTATGSAAVVDHAGSVDPKPDPKAEALGSAAGSGDARTIETKRPIQPPIHHPVTTKPKVTPTVHHPAATTTTDETKPAVKEVKEVPVVPAPKEKCDPFSAMHRCADK